MTEQPKYIGMSQMDAKGTIIVDLRAEHADTTMGVGRLVYPLGHPQYADILKHLGGLLPGENKPVLPWPEATQ
jgi:hypothetical protein